MKIEKFICDGCGKEVGIAETQMRFYKAELSRGNGISAIYRTFDEGDYTFHAPDCLIEWLKNPHRRIRKMTESFFEQEKGP